jgi:hypothetical protein
LRLKESVAMRKPVVRQIKKPIEKRRVRPIFWPIDILRRMTTGIGSMKIERSVARFEIALDQLDTMLVPHVIIYERLGKGKGSLPMSSEADACPWNLSIVHSGYRRALEDTHKHIGDRPCN